MRLYLAASYQWTPLPALWAVPLARLLSETGTASIVDLGSGASGPIHLVLGELERQGLTPSVTLTDLYPVQFADSDSRATRVRTHAEPVDARAVPSSLVGIRTMFATFHHLRCEDAASVLRDAFTQRQAVAIFEGTARTLPAVALSLLIPLLVLALTPKVRPLSAAQIVFTYVIPILPLLIFWDGLVSQVRTYSVDDLRRLTTDLQAPDYHWTIDTLSAKGLPLSVPYLIGRAA